jgi:hypothetical protein
MLVATKAHAQKKPASEFRDMRTLWRILTIALLAACVTFGVIDISMYGWPSIPSSPRPSEGRIFPLNNHGHYTYMNRSEYLLRESMQWGFILAAIALGVIQHFVNPFDEKKKPRPLRPPPPW